LKDDEALESIPSAKKSKTKVVPTKDNDGWVHQKVKTLDEDGKELPKTEEKIKPKKESLSASSTKKEKVNPISNIFDLANESDNVPTQAEYLASVRDARIKGKPEKPEKQAQKKQPKAEKPKEAAPEPKEKKVKQLKVQKKPEVEKKNVVVADVPFWQNELFKPLVYVFGLVSFLSFLYLVLN